MSDDADNKHEKRENIGNNHLFKGIIKKIKQKHHNTFHKSQNSSTLTFKSQNSSLNSIIYL